MFSIIDSRTKSPEFPRGFLFNWATSYSPTHLARAVPSGLKGLTTVFGMGTGGTPSLQSPKTCRARHASPLPNIDGNHFATGHRPLATGHLLFHAAPPLAFTLATAYSAIQGKFYGQAERAISNGQLNWLPSFHIRPINVVVFHGPY